MLSTPHFLAFQEAFRSTGSDQAQRSSYFRDFSAPDAERRFLENNAAYLRGVLAGSSSAPEDIEVYVRALGTPDALRAALNWYRAAGLANAVSRPFGREAAEATAKYIVGPYRFEVLEGVTHWVPEQAAERVNELLLDHLRARDRR